MANEQHLEIVDTGRGAVAAFQASGSGPLDLGHADLADRDLRGFNFRGARFDRADFTGTRLSHADMAGTSLRRCDLTMADLDGADLSQADLFRASFTAAGLSGTIFSDACFGFTCISDCDRSAAIGLEATIHDIPSSVGTDTLLKSLRSSGVTFSETLREFFLKSGLSLEMIDAVQSAEQKSVYCTCYVAYGSPDEEFARQLSGALSARGVHCWFFPVDARAGRPTKAEERRGLQTTEKVLVICSVAGLASPGVLREIDETAGDDTKRLLPVLRDRDWLGEGTVVARDGHDLKQHLRNNVWVDFSVDEFDNCLERLLSGLAKGSSPPER